MQKPGFLRVGILTLLAMIIQFDVAGQRPLIPYRAVDVWGYCTNDREIVIHPQFNSASLFHGAYAVVAGDSGEFLIDAKGQRVSPFFKTVVRGDNDHVYYLGYFEDNRCALFQLTDGKQVTPIVRRVWAFNEDGLAVMEDGDYKKTVIDQRGQAVLPATYDHIELFPGKLALVSKNWKWGVHNLSLNIAVPCQYDRIYPFQEGLAFAKKGERYGFINTRGEEVIPFEYDRVPWNAYFGEQNFFNFNFNNFSEGLAVVMKGGKAGFIDGHGKVVIPFRYDLAYGFDKGLAWVKRNGKWGMIDKSGKQVIPCQYDEYDNLSDKELEALIGVSDGMIRLMKDGKAGFADSTGRLVVPHQFEDVSSYHNGYAVFYEKERWGFLNKKGDRVIPPKFKAVLNRDSYYGGYPFSRGYAIVWPTDSTMTIIDTNGKALLEREVSSFSDFADGFAVGNTRDSTLIFDQTGKIVHALPGNRSVAIFDSTLAYDYTEECFFNPRTGVRYCE